MYVNLPVKLDTKKRVDEFRRSFGVRSYDETLKELTKINSFRLLADLEGIIEGSPEFRRDKRDRDFG